MHPSGRLRFLTYLFRIFMYLSNGYIHLKYTKPHNFISLTKCTVRCIIISKTLRGKNCSNMHNVTTSSRYSSSNLDTLTTLKQIPLKNKYNLVIAYRTFLDNTT
ncbi:hypothetical protein PanWU01x14_134480 [Parasponia andersonii]|uniref:Uncharacterized protein n=1 Tax=Parasponia andersonii TaxID=3476 RepID=A0A2P5CPP8_PARAD|nr:hypothetical protein PanWU01x14_134480 [Parasponia andersonii]